MLTGLDEDDVEPTQGWRRFGLGSKVVLVGAALALGVPLVLWLSLSYSQRQIRSEPAPQAELGADFADARRFWQALRRRDHAELRTFLGERREAGTASALELLALAALHQDVGEVDAARTILGGLQEHAAGLDPQSQAILARQAYLEGRIDEAVVRMVAAVQADPQLLSNRQARPRGFIVELVMDLARRGRHQEVLGLLPMAVVAEDRSLHPFVINAGLALGDRDLVLLLLSSPVSPFQGIARDRVLASAYEIFNEREVAAQHWQAALSAAKESANARELKLIGGTALVRGRFAIARKAYAAAIEVGGPSFFTEQDHDQYAWALLRSNPAADAIRELSPLGRRFPDIVAYRVAGEYATLMANPQGTSGGRLREVPPGRWSEVRAAADAWQWIPDQPLAALRHLEPWHVRGGNPDPAIAVAYLCSLAAAGRAEEARQLRAGLVRAVLSPEEMSRLRDYLGGW